MQLCPSSDAVRREAGRELRAGTGGVNALAGLSTTRRGRELGLNQGRSLAVWVKRPGVDKGVCLKRCEGGLAGPVSRLIQGRVQYRLGQKAWVRQGLGLNHR